MTDQHDENALYLQAVRAGQWRAAYGSHLEPRTTDQISEDIEYENAVNAQKHTPNMSAEDQELWNSIHNTTN